MALIDYTGKQGGDRYHDLHHDDFEGMFKDKYLIQAWSDYTKMSYFQGIKKNSKILEIGSGYGRNVIGLNADHEVTVFEPGPKAREHCQSLGLKTIASLEEIEPGKTFDVILLRHVLEHIPNPQEMLEEVKKILAPKGKLILVLPIEPLFSKPQANDRDFHLFCWNRQTIHNFLNQQGYSVIESRMNWFNGRRLFLSVYKMFGIQAYSFLMSLLGRLRRKVEMVVVAGKTGEYEDCLRSSL